MKKSTILAYEDLEVEEKHAMRLLIAFSSRVYILHGYVRQEKISETERMHMLGMANPRAFADAIGFAMFAFQIAGQPHRLLSP